MNKNTTSHQKITDLLKQHGLLDYHGGIQLFTDQYDKNWSISINFNGTGLHIPHKEIDEEELVDDELIKLYKSWTYKE